MITFYTFYEKNSQKLNFSEIELPFAPFLNQIKDLFKGK